MKIRFALCFLLFSGGPVALMRTFSANERPATIMGRISRGYTPEQIALLAAHYARPQ
jgi:cytochrome c553